MKEYHKIQTVWKRDPLTNHKSLIKNGWATPEFEYLATRPWVWTEKVDGTNVRVLLPDYHEDGTQYGISFGGRTDNASLPAKLVERLQERFMVIKQRQQLAEMFPNGACLYGEGYGAKIQKGGGNYRSDQDFVLFDVKVGDWWLRREDVEDVAAKLDLDVVPVIGHGNLYGMINRVRFGFKSMWGNFGAEGIVARPRTELFARNGARIITKIKAKDFPNEIQ